MFEKSSLFSAPAVSPMGFCSSSQCKKGCNGASGSAIGDVEGDNTNPSGY